MVVRVSLHTQTSAITVIQDLSFVDYSQSFITKSIFCFVYTL